MEASLERDRKAAARAAVAGGEGPDAADVDGDGSDDLDEQMLEEVDEDDLDYEDLDAMAAVSSAGW